MSWTTSFISKRIAKPRRKTKDNWGKKIGLVFSSHFIPSGRRPRKETPTMNQSTWLSSFFRRRYCNYRFPNQKHTDNRNKR
jgi:hypothetical protein